MKTEKACCGNCQHFDPESDQDDFPGRGRCFWPLNQGLVNLWVECEQVMEEDEACQHWEEQKEDGDV